MHGLPEHPCRRCEYFCNREEIGWIDTHNNIFIVFCENGKVRSVDSLDEGCPYFEENPFYGLDVN